MNHSFHKVKIIERRKKRIGERNKKGKREEKKEE